MESDDIDKVKEFFEKREEPIDFEGLLPYSECMFDEIIGKPWNNKHPGRLFDILIEKGIGDKDSYIGSGYKRETLFCRAVRSKEVDCILYFIEYFANPFLTGTKGITPKEIAKESGMLRIVKLLEDYEQFYESKLKMGFFIINFEFEVTKY